MKKSRISFFLLLLCLAVPWLLSGYILYVHHNFVQSAQEEIMRLQQTICMSHVPDSDSPVTLTAEEADGLLRDIYNTEFASAGSSMKTLYSAQNLLILSQDPQASAYLQDFFTGLTSDQQAYLIHVWIGLSTTARDLLDESSLAHQHLCEISSSFEENFPAYSLTALDNLQWEALDIFDAACVNLSLSAADSDSTWLSPEQ